MILRQAWRAAASSLLAVLAVDVAPCAAQWTPCRQFTVREGLAQSQVTGLALDAAGYLWVATQGGVSRFEGRRFVTFTTVDGLPDDVVSAIAAAPDGSVWIGTDSGALARWDGHGFSRWNGETPWRSAVAALAVLPAGDPLVGTEDGLFVLHSGRARRLVPGRVSSLAAAGREVLAIVAGAVARVAADGSVTAVALPRGHAAVAIAAGVDGSWAATDRGAIVDVGSGRVLSGLDPATDTVRALLPDGEGGVWVGGNRALWGRAESGRVESVLLYPSEPVVAVSALLRDREGSLWVGTWGQGLFQRPPGPTTLFTTESGLPSSTVWTFAEDRRGCVWMGTENAGVVAWCEDGWHRHEELNRLLPNPRVLALAWTPDDTLWIGCEQGLARWRAGRSFELYRRANGLPHDFIRALVPHGEHELWIATSGGLAYWDGSGFRKWLPGNGLPAGPVRSLAVDGSGVLWLATHSGGVVRFDGTTFTSFTTANGLPNDRVWSIAVDGRDRVWAGTDAGVWVHPIAGGRDTVVGLADGLPSLNVLLLQEDAEGFMWVGTTRGFCRVDGEGHVVRTFTARDGFSDSEAAENAVLRQRSGLLWFGASSGVTRVDTRRLQRNPVPPPLAIRSVLVNGTPLAGAGAAGGTSTRAEELILGPDTTELRFELAALSFMSPDQVRFRFMLEGFDPTWSAPTDEDHATYRRLPPGRYRFLVTASNNEGVWASAPAGLSVRILPAWYQTRTFRFGSGAAVLLGALGWVGARISAQRRRRQELEAEVALRTRELRDANARILAQNRALDELSRTDPLTGLANRRVLGEQLPLEMALVRREVRREDVRELAGYHGVGLLMLDLDHFKRINDRWGHEAGDRVLKAFADSLRAMLREVDLPVRVGGEEFVVLARGVDRTGLAGLVQRVEEAVAATAVEVTGGKLACATVSVGFFSYPLGLSEPLGAEEWPRLVELADRLLYLAKQRGRTRACGLMWRPGAEPELGEAAMLDHLLQVPLADHAGLELIEIPLTASHPLSLTTT